MRHVMAQKSDEVRKRTLLFVRDAFFITLFKTLFSIYKIHEFFTSRGSVESACKV